jgi:hypothetical protein
MAQPGKYQTNIKLLSTLLVNLQAHFGSYAAVIFAAPICNGSPDQEESSDDWY